MHPTRVTTCQWCLRKMEFKGTIQPGRRYVCASCYPEAFVNAVRTQLVEQAKRLEVLEAMRDGRRTRHAPQAAMASMTTEPTRPDARPGQRRLSRTPDRTAMAMRSAKAIFDKAPAAPLARTLDLSTSEIQAIAGYVRDGGSRARCRKMQTLIGEKIANLDAALAELREYRQSLQRLREDLARLTDSQWEVVAWYLATGETSAEIVSRGPLSVESLGLRG